LRESQEKRRTTQPVAKSEAAAITEEVLRIGIFIEC